MTEERTFKPDSWGNIYGETMVTPVGRASYPTLDKPGQKYKKYSLTILFDKKSADKAKLNAMIKECGVLAEHSTRELGPKKPIRDGDTELNKKGEPMSPGNYVIQANSPDKPRVLQSKNGANVDVDASVIIPGVQVVAVVQPILCDKGFTYKLKAVQFVKDDGTRFVQGVDPVELLDVLAEDDAAPTEEVLEGANEELETAEEPKKKGRPAKIVAGKQAALDLL